jgi:hypothetical protein
VRLDDEDLVCLEAEGFIPAAGSEEMAYFFGRNLHDHLAAAVSNLLAAGPPRFERSVNYTNLSADAVAELNDLARTRGMELLRELNAHALGLQQRDAGRDGATRRWNAGLYVFDEDETPAGGERQARDATTRGTTKR